MKQCMHWLMIGSLLGTLLQPPARARGEQPGAAVLDLAAAGLQPGTADFLRDFLRQEIAGSGKVATLGAATVRAAVQAAGQAGARCAAAACATELGRTLRVPRVVIGRAGQDGAQYQLELEIVDAVSGAVVYAKTATAVNENGLFARAAELVEPLIEVLAQPASGELPAATPARPEAPPATPAQAVPAAATGGAATAPVVPAPQPVPVGGGPQPPAQPVQPVPAGGSPPAQPVQPVPAGGSPPAQPAPAPPQPAPAGGAEATQPAPAGGPQATEAAESAPAQGPGRARLWLGIAAIGAIGATVFLVLGGNEEDGGGGGGTPAPTTPLPDPPDHQ